ncbi:RRNA processing protein [Coemansia sp. S16]|nr:RRNA processing protein [Coemansia sp. S680]KAJ2039413.1 RRNA processing protein [Coemansia sp. S3946]KAJ2044807.1 RRNA processing protein [Coemansia sp. S16]KAJ2046641.1 RRNA processing protein [Coemansia sp. S2]KAJ2072405.1 RRNA processing protein [Coemansia sp. S155-1]KAJ2100707.1 RRNA processing protein [Coemansia sp. S142-1]
MSDDEQMYDEAMMEDEETALEIAALQSEDLLPQPKKEFINHKVALRALVDELSQKSLNWIQRCDVTSAEPIVVDKTENDLDRELKFYQQGLEAVIQAQLEVKKVGVPFSRPDDYFAEMVKSDAHMARIRQKLLDQQKGIQNSEEAKKQRELRKYGKKIEQEKLREREDQKKASLDKIATIKKRLRSGDLGEVDDFDIDVDSGDEGGKKAKGARGKKGKDGKPMANHKRLSKNEKFGFGGKKRGLRKNTAESTSDMSGFSQKRNKSANFSAVHQRGKTKRPGKSKRQRTN